MSSSLNGVKGSTGSEMIPFAYASDVAGSGPKPTTNNSRWSMAGDWAKAHKKELIIAALVIGTIAGIALMWYGIPLVAAATPAAPSALGAITSTLGFALTTISFVSFIAALNPKNWEDF